MCAAKRRGNNNNNNLLQRTQRYSHQPEAQINNQKMNNEGNTNNNSDDDTSGSSLPCPCNRFSTPFSAPALPLRRTNTCISPNNNNTERLSTACNTRTHTLVLVHIQLNGDAAAEETTGNEDGGGGGMATN